MLEEHVQARRAIEALRAGVPNRDAVIALGSTSDRIEERFRQELNQAREGGTAYGPSGFLVAGNFGSGKSHLLEYLQQTALQENFVTSKVIISKETPLYDPVKLYRSAIRAASVPGRVGAALTQIASELEFNSPGYTDFYHWVQASDELNKRFASTVYLYEYAREDPELRDRIISFWAGNPIQVGEIKRALRQAGERVAYNLGRASLRELAYQRFRFAARLIMAAGYAGWVLLFDEVDLVARYSLQQRAKSYAEIARWTGGLPKESYAGITSVLATTSEYEALFIDGGPGGRNDRETVPGKLHQSPREADRLLASQAEKGMRLIGKALPLPTPNRDVVQEIYEKVKFVHGQAYSWSPPPIGESDEWLTSTRMRQYVRRWINEWDLKRLFPDYDPVIEVTNVEPNYAEDTDLETPEEANTDATNQAE